MGFGGPAKSGVGKLRERLVILSPVRTSGATGQAKVSSWTTVGTVWGSVASLGNGTEPYRHDAQVSESTHIVKIRGGLGVTHTWRIQWGSILFEVVAVPVVDSGITNEQTLFVKHVDPGP